MINAKNKNELNDYLINLNVKYDALNIFKHLVLFVCKKIFLLKSVNDFRGL